MPDAERAPVPVTPRIVLPPAGLLLSLLLLAAGGPAAAQERVLDAGPHRLRAGSVPEWSESAAHPHQPVLELRFEVEAPNRTERTLSLRQAGVKREWGIELNGAPIGQLHADENPMVVHRAVPVGALRAGSNLLRIIPADTLADDIEIADVRLHAQPPAVMLSAGVLELMVRGEDNAPLPARITLLDQKGFLREIGTSSGGRLAVRPGVVYTGDGRAELRVPEGSFRLYASRGFEYGVDSAQVLIRAGDRAERTLRLRREVTTDGWVSSDTHVHTFTHSGHGDASVEERVITIAGEGIELPILTDHDIHADLGAAAEALGVRPHFTPVAGNELTTPVGHFNLFPVPLDVAAPSPDLEDWAGVARAIEATGGVQGIVLNHPRDVHQHFRPFGSAGIVTLPGERDPEHAGAWTLPANAMEVVNSGSQQNDPLELFRDWLELLRRGHRLTPVGSSDSHDLARYIVGQARTYIRVDDDDAARIAVDDAMQSFRAGAVMVSFGLLAEITVDGRYGPGDRVPPEGGEMEVAVRVLGPSWTRAERVSLYVDGARVRTEPVDDAGIGGVKWSGSWRIPRPPAGSHLVALAEGPDPERPFWPVARPYQPTGPAVEVRVIGISGAVRVQGR